MNLLSRSENKSNGKKKFKVERKSIEILRETSNKQPKNGYNHYS